MKSPIQRTAFDVYNKDHRKAYLDFIQQARWSAYFELEQPWLELPAMCEHKLTQYYLELEFKSV